MKPYAAVSRFRELELPIGWTWAAVPIGTGSNSNGPKYIKTNGPISSWAEKAKIREISPKF